MAAAEMLNRACPSTAITANWFASIARVIEKYGSKELKDEYIPRLAKGEISGNMALTEPDAGSDLSGIKTYAVPQNDGTWTLHGTKRFITNGAGGLSLVLAKSEKGALGLDKLSLFLCPRLLDGKDNIKLLKIEKKVGLHGSITAELAYDGAKAWLLGEKNAGFRYMLDLMNESRIGVALQASPDDRGKIAGKAARSLCYETIFLQSMRNLLERRLRDGKGTDTSIPMLEKQLASVTREVRARTPLIKYWLSEKAVEHARVGLQIHGGYGYMHEYKAEWLLREALIYPLYEGTSQIQALMCIKDAIKDLIKNPRVLFDRTLRGTVHSFVKRDVVQRKFSQIKEITGKALLVIVYKLVKLNAKGTGVEKVKRNPLALVRMLNLKNLKIQDLSPALLQAENFCELRCIEALASSLVSDSTMDPSRKWIAERFLFKALPRATYLYSLIKAEDRILRERLLH